MTASFGAIGRIGYGARTNTIVPMPAGVTQNQHLLMVLVTANSGTAVTATLPAGWAARGAAQVGTDGSFGFRAVMADRISQVGEPSTYTATHAASNSEAMIVRTDGAGTLSADVFSVNTGPVSGTSSALAVTPTAADDLLYFIGLNWDVAALSPPTGMTERQDSQILYLASQALVSAGSTGARTQAHSSSPWFANLFAIKDVAGGGPSSKLKVWNGSAWAQKPAKVWSGSAWVTKPVKTWNGSAWI